MNRRSSHATLLVVFALVGSTLLMPATAETRPRAALAPADCKGPQRFREDLAPFVETEPPDQRTPAPTVTPKTYDAASYTSPPNGTQADSATVNQVQQTVQGMIDCYNAKDASRMLAFFS